MTSLVHIGDVHAAPGPRSADRWRAVDQIVREGLALEQLGAWLIPGDLFDALSTTEDRNAWDARLQRMADVAPVVIIYGNHDRPGDLDGFANLKANHSIYVIDRPHVLVLRLATLQMAAIFCLPYPQKAGLVGAGVASGDVVAAGGDLLEPIFMTAAAQLQDCAAAGMFTLMIGHVNVAGAQLSNGQPSIGHEIELNPKHLDRLGDIPKLLNHIHKPQTIAGAHYAGSVCRLDYGEIEEKRYLVVNFYDEDTEIVSKPLDVAPMFHVEGELTRDGFFLSQDAPLCPICDGIGTDQDALEFTDVAPPCPSCDGRGRRLIWEGCDVRVRYSYKASEKAVIKEEAVREIFKHALRLKVEGVAISDRELRAPAVAAAKTLPDKLAAYRKVEQLEPSIAAKVALLERGDTTAVLAGVVERLRVLEQHEKARVAA